VTQILFVCVCVCVVAETGDVKASIAVISFIISNATKFSVDADSLSNELQQLGLPKGSFKTCRSGLFIYFSKLYIDYA